MTLTMWGAVLGVAIGGGLLLVVTRVVAIRRPQLELRVLPYVRDLPQVSRSALRVATATPTPATVGVFGPVLRTAADGVERVLGGSTSVRRRLDRANLDKTVHEFRVEQVVWGLVGFVAAAAASVLVALRSPGRTLPLLILCCVAFAVGVLLRENRLTAQVRERERRVLEEFPTIAEMLALAVAAGESPVSALDRVARRSQGELSADLGRVLAEVRTGTPLHRVPYGTFREDRG